MVARGDGSAPGELLCVVRDGRIVKGDAEEGLGLLKIDSKNLFGRREGTRMSPDTERIRRGGMNVSLTFSPAC